VLVGAGPTGVEMAGVTTLEEVESRQLSERGRASYTNAVPCPASRLAVASPLAPRSWQNRFDHEPRFSGMRCGKPSCEIPVDFLELRHGDCPIGARTRTRRSSSRSTEDLAGGGRTLRGRNSHAVRAGSSCRVSVVSFAVDSDRA
jgi:hypothetical protein